MTPLPLKISKLWLAGLFNLSLVLPNDSADLSMYWSQQTCGVSVGCCKNTLPRTRMPTSVIYSEYIRKAAVEHMRDLFILFLLVKRLGRLPVGSSNINITQVDLNQVAQDQLGHLRPTSPKLILISSFSAAAYEPPDEVSHGFPWVGEHHYRGQ